MRIVRSFQPSALNLFWPCAGWFSDILGALRFEMIHFTNAVDESRDTRFNVEAQTEQGEMSRSKAKHRRTEREENKSTACASNRTKKYIKPTIVVRPNTARSECYQLKALLVTTSLSQSMERAIDICSYRCPHGPGSSSWSLHEIFGPWSKNLP